MKKTMLAVVKQKPGKGVTLQRVPIPKPNPGEILIKVIYASICGTDIGIYDWTPWAADHMKLPTIPGHEVLGEVIEVNPSICLGPVGIAQNLKRGDLVSSETHIFCGSCYQCKIGNSHVCENLELFGISRNGSFAEYATIPIHTTWKNPSTSLRVNPSTSREQKEFSPKIMSVQEPLGNAVHVIWKAQVQGKRVLIIGLGPTGLCAGMVAKAYGASEVVGLNRGKYRRTLAKKVKFDRVLQNLDKKEFNTFDVVIEMSGNPLGIQTAFDAVRIAGTILAFGIPKKEILLDWGKYIINKEITIKSIFGRRIWDTWYRTSDLLKNKKIDLAKIITHQYPLKDFEKAMEVMKSGQCGKILLKV